MPSEMTMKEFVIELLNTHLPPYYYYHNVDHTLYVMDRAIEIAKAENCTEHEIELLITATLWHDSGYINKYNRHEEESCALAQQYLPEFGYTEIDINAVCDLIMATKVPQMPKNKLEEIIDDADLEYLGTPDAEIVADNLYKELRYRDPSLTKEKWDKKQIAFIQKHHYFTSYCREKREGGKSAYLNKLVSRLNK